jgi:acyl-coenzyme A synthetase/AMP-(fatty) acid ligase
VTIGFFLDVFRERAETEAIVFRDGSYSFQWLHRAIEEATIELRRAGIAAGAVVSLEADFSHTSIAHLLALIAIGAIVVPIAPSSEANRWSLRELAQVEWQVALTELGGARIEHVDRPADAPLYAALRSAGHPGLVLFTSGSTGEPKGAVHDCERLLLKYQKRRAPFRTLMFLLFDHIGGIDTLFQALANGGTVVIPATRSPEDVCAAIARHRVEVLPTAPSFITMLLLSEAHRRHDLASLRYVTYGAEVMPQTTLDRLAAEFPQVTLLQKYGITEVGTLRSRSRSNGSLWVKVGGEGYETRVVDGILQIRAASSMLGYLNAPSPFTPDGWFITGDAVEVEGEYLRILGRASDLINVGGRKVYPAEVETVIQEMDNVTEVAVFGERHPFTGQIVVAKVKLRTPEDPVALERRIRSHCRSRIEAYKVPARVLVSDDALHTERLKTTRR